MMRLRNDRGTSVIVLAGGASSRMGTDKAMLPIEGVPVIRHIVEKLSPIGPVMVVTNHPERYRWLEVPMVKDREQGKGPLAGLHAGLSVSVSETNLVVACDMPFVSRRAAVWLLSRLGNAFACVPTLGGRPHPLFAVYRKSCLSALARCLREGKLQVRRFLSEVPTRFVSLEEAGLGEEAELCVWNMNRPEDYHQALHMAQAESSFADKRDDGPSEK
ncbi:putative molybdenum cofactor guanylyltransferase [Polycladomyces abyssicola]|uniref:Probable molybdenum cofactor guanylyltransferase n=1 Tax=Polycladomyces abyssicola TaxID=1125966 RepID=A0A8D5UED3_9BACL|nr:molybdenum cofactor guanylyltransferase [Polycladomyces abyssicola]BCU81163.1 putative molybdenum cofactor guanylyltransferase [Polycladomyces abyssicola]